MVTHSGMVERSNADGHCCVKIFLASILTKVQGEAIILMECTKLQELKE